MTELEQRNEQQQRTIEKEIKEKIVFALKVDEMKNVVEGMKKEAQKMLEERLYVEHERDVARTETQAAICQGEKNVAALTKDFQQKTVRLKSEHEGDKAAALRFSNLLEKKISSLESKLEIKDRQMQKYVVL